ncbi:MAG: hypothetical protein WBI42_01755, partial [Candidatus Hydrothermia bacterium]
CNLPYLEAIIKLAGWACKIDKRKTQGAFPSRRKTIDKIEYHTYEKVRIKSPCPQMDPKTCPEIY